jgi:hypothetical protein
VPGHSHITPLRGGLLALLACVSLPAFAASGFKNCDDAPAKPADLTASSAADAESAGDHDALTVLRAEGDSRSLSAFSDLGRMVEPEFEQKSVLTSMEQKRMRASALADALERRRPGQLDTRSDELEADTEAPRSLDTALPGVGDSESLFYRREMYRTDI